MKSPEVVEEKSASPTNDLSDLSRTAQHQESQEETIRPEKKPLKFKLTVLMLCTISVVVAMDSVIVAATLPAIVVALNGTSLEAFWVGTSYLLAQTVSSNLIQ